MRFTTANNQFIDALGCLNLRFSINNKRCVGRFYVFKHLSQDIILGRPFLSENRVILNYATQNKEAEAGCDIASVSKHIIPPGERLMLKGKVIGKRIPTGLEGYVGQHRRRNGLMIAGIAATVSNNYVPIVVENDTDDSITIKRNQKIASFKPLSSQQIENRGMSDTQQTKNFDKSYTKRNLSINHIGGHVKVEQNIEAMKTTLSEEYGVTIEQQSEEDKRNLTKVIYANKAAFTDSTGVLGFSDLVEQEITLKPGAIPIVRQPYRLDYETKTEVRKQIRALLDNDILVEQYSTWASPLVAVKKQAPRARKHMRGTQSKPEIRIVVDFRHLNGQILTQAAHIPCVADILEDVAREKAKFYSCMDLRQGFLQQGLKRASQKYTAFLYDGKSYCWTRSPQGLKNSPGLFQRLVNKILEDVACPKEVHAYIDDILIATKTKQRHLELIDKVLGAFAKAGMTFSGKKCHFMQPTTEFLGFEISHEGVTIPQKHTSAMKSWPTPTSVKDIRSFLGCANYFRAYLSDRASMTGPLSQLTKKGVKFKWEEPQRQAFEAIKSQLSNKPLLRHPDFSQEFHVFCDASSMGIGAALAQKNTETGDFMPVAFYGRATSDTERLWSATDLEFLALVSSVRNWETYLRPRKFKVATDHQALLSMVAGNMKLSAKLQRYATYMGEFEFELVHIKGVHNVIADSLSRRRYPANTSMGSMIFCPKTEELFTNSKHHITAITRAARLKQAKAKLEQNKSNAMTSAEESTPVQNQDANHSSEPRVEDRIYMEDTSDEEVQMDNDDQMMKDKVKANKDSSNASKADKDGLPSTQKLIAEQQADEFCNDIIQLLEHGTLPECSVRRARCQKREMEFCLKDGVLTQIWEPLIGKGLRYRTMIPKSLQEDYIVAIHNSCVMAHLSVDKTISLLREKVIFKGMYQRVRDVIAQCEVCKLVKTQTHPLKRPPGLYELTTEVFARCHSDFGGPYHETRSGAKYLCVVVDSTTNFLIAWAAREITSESFARAFYKNVTTIHGSPATLVTDNASYYHARIWKEVAAKLGIQLRYSSPYSPKSNGTAERFVGSLKAALRCTIRDRTTNWDEYISSAVYGLNNTISSNHQLTPHALVFGRNGRNLLSENKEPAQEPLFQIIHDLESYREEAAKVALEARRHRDNTRLQKEPQDVKYDVLVPGDVVFWKKQNARHGLNQDKLSGPYMVVSANRFVARIKHLHTGKTHELPINITQLVRARDFQTEPGLERNGPLLFRP
jgi:dUTPase